MMYEVAISLAKEAAEQCNKAIDAGILANAILNFLHCYMFINQADAVAGYDSMSKELVSPLEFNSRINEMHSLKCQTQSIIIDLVDKLAENQDIDIHMFRLNLPEEDTNA